MHNPPHLAPRVYVPPYPTERGPWRPSVPFIFVMGAAFGAVFPIFLQGFF